MGLLPPAAWLWAQHRLARPTQAAVEGRSSKHAAHRLEKRIPWPCYLETVNERAISASQRHTAFQPMDAGIHCRSLSLLISTARDRLAHPR